MCSGLLQYIRRNARYFCKKMWFPRRNLPEGHLHGQTQIRNIIMHFASLASWSNLLRNHILLDEQSHIRSLTRTGSWTHQYYMSKMFSLILQTLRLHWQLIAGSCLLFCRSSTCGSSPQSTSMQTAVKDGWVGRQVCLGFGKAESFAFNQIFSNQKALSNTERFSFSHKPADLFWRPWWPPWKDIYVHSCLSAI